MECLYCQISVQVVLIILCKFCLFGEKFCQFFNEMKSVLAESQDCKDLALAGACLLSEDTFPLILAGLEIRVLDANSV